MISPAFWEVAEFSRGCGEAGSGADQVLVLGREPQAAPS